MSLQPYMVRVTKDHLVFCCGHFITYAGQQCERLHGHNYRATVELEGDLDENYYVFDFVALKQATKAIVDDLDHHMLLALEHPLIELDVDDRRVRVRFQEREWVFPRDDCKLLPIENTTAERIAYYIAERLRKNLLEQYHFSPRRLRVEVEETVGQSAIFTWSSPEAT